MKIEKVKLLGKFKYSESSKDQAIGIHSGFIVSREISLIYNVSLDPENVK